MSFIFVVDGNWENWGSFSKCSKTCGAGSRIRRRKCSAPNNGGKDCVGPYLESTACNMASCSGKKLSSFQSSHIRE